MIIWLFLKRVAGSIIPDIRRIADEVRAYLKYKMKV